MKKILITGGAGFIGTNAVHYFAKKGWNVCLLDNLSRKGSSLNHKIYRLKKPQAASSKQQAPAKQPEVVEKKI